MPEATPVAPAPVVTPTPVPAAISSPAPIDTKAELEKLDSARRDIERKERMHVQRVRQSAEEKKTLGEKLSRLSELEKREQQAKLNPVAYLKSVYGEGWYDIATKAKLDGIPPADLVAGEIERVREDVRKEFTARDEQRQQADLESARRAVLSSAHEFVASSAKEYPVFEGYPQATVAALLAQRVENEYNLAYKRNETTGTPTAPISIKAAADLVEAEMLAIAERVAASEKYRAKLAEKLKPAPVAPAVVAPTNQRTDSQQRRTLSNDLTGTTPSKAAPLSDAERRQRALAARDAHKSTSST